MSHAEIYNNPPDELSLYIHIPFCTRICHYCDFAKTARFDDTLVDLYFQKIIQEIELYDFSERFKFSSIFFGGGTPSLFPEFTQKILDFTSNRWDHNTEITLEVNPEHLNQKNLKTWKEQGINRLSIGVQSFDNKELAFLTREHRREKTLEQLLEARSFFENISLDLIYGLPKQTSQSISSHLEDIKTINPKHVSFYHLTYEPQTVIGRKFHRGLLKPMTSNASFKMYQTICSELAAQGFEHYEVSNWAKKSFQSQHNLRYWQLQSYMGIGVGAHSYFRDDYIGKRFFHSKKLQSYLHNSVPTLEDDRTLDSYLLEVLSSGLRTKTGVNLKLLDHFFKFDPTLNPIIKQAIKNNTLSISSEHIRLIKPEWFREQSWCLELEKTFLPHPVVMNPPHEIDTI